MRANSAKSSTRSSIANYGFALEGLEQRRLLSISSWTSGSISNLSGTYFGDVQMGDNGSYWGSPTAAAGQGGNAEVSSASEWDSDLDDGLNSGWRNFAMNVNTSNDGNVALSVGGSSVGTFASSSSVAVHSVTLRAAVLSSDLEMDWRNLTVQFYHAGSVVQTVSLSDFSASTMSSGTTMESGVVVTPTASNCDGVAISGQVRLQGAIGAYPGPSDLFGDVLVS